MKQSTRLHGAMLAVLLALLAYLIHRSYGWNPAVFADEWSYSKYSHLAPLAESIVPSYLYLWAMGASTACGSGFLECVRGANALAFLGAAPFLYLIARVYMAPLLAAWVALLCCLLPMGSYTAFFMPEALYYAGFCVLSWYALNRVRGDDWRQGGVAGVLLGLLSLIKVHAVFLLPALCLYLAFVYADTAAPRRWLRAGAAAALAAGAAFATKFGISYLLVGKSGLSVFGSFYGATAAAKPDRLQLLAQAAHNGFGHAMALALVLAVPLAILLHTLLSALFARMGLRTLRLSLYTALMLGSGAGLSILYTASLAVNVPEEALRLHLRYYNFVFPLLVVGAAAAIGTPRFERYRPLPWVLVPLLGLCAWLARQQLPHYRVLLIDAPEVFGIANDPLTLTVAALAAVLALLLWAMHSRYGAALCVFVLLPATALVAEARLPAAMHYLADESPFDSAGKFVHDHLALDQRAHLTVMGSNVAQLMRALFQIDAPGADFVELPDQARARADLLPAGRSWLLVVGPHALPEGMPVAYRDAQFALLQAGPASGSAAGVTHFGAVRPGGPVVAADGLADREQHGRWSSGPEVVLHTLQALPRKLTLTVRAAAFGPNVGAPVRVRVGDASAVLIFGPDVQTRTLRLDTDGSTRAIGFTIAHPTSPLSLGQSADPRLLGILFDSVTVAAHD